MIRLRFRRLLMPIDMNCTHYKKKKKKEEKKKEEKKKEKKKTQKKIKVGNTIWDKPLFKLYTAQCNILTENI